MKLKGMFLGSSAMTPTELKVGRLLRAPDGHPDGGAPAPAAAEPAPAAEAAPVAAPAAGGEEDFADFEAALAKGEADEGGDAAPAPAKGESEDGTDPAPKPEGEPKPEIKSDDVAAKEREALEARLAKAEADLKALQPKPEKPAGQAGAPKDEAPNPEDYEFGEADAKFIADHARYHAILGVREEQQRQAGAAEVAVVEAKWNSAVAQADVAERYPDFQTKVVEAANAGTWACTPLMALAIKDSPVGPDVAYHLASDPTEALRVANLSPLEQARELGRIEGRFSSNQQAPAPKPKLGTQAPEPPLNRSRGAGGKFSVDAATDDFAAFESMADGVLAKKRR